MGALAGTGQAAEKMTATEMTSIMGAQAGMSCTATNPGSCAYVPLAPPACERFVPLPYPQCESGDPCDVCNSREWSSCEFTGYVLDSSDANPDNWFCTSTVNAYIKAAKTGCI
jgi:hypothetical protein